MITVIEMIAIREVSVAIASCFGVKFIAFKSKEKKHLDSVKVRNDWDIFRTSGSNGVCFCPGR